MSPRPPRTARLAAALSSPLRRWPDRPLPALLLAATVLLALAALDPAAPTALAPALALAPAAVGVSVLTGRAGLPTLGQAAPFAVGAYGTALLARAGLTVGPLQLAAAALTGALFALLTGLVVVRTRGTTALMITLALGELTATAAGRWTSVTGGADGLAGVPAVRLWWGLDALTDDRDLYGYLAVVALLATGAAVLALRSPLGLLLDAVREQEPRMRAAGHRVGGALLAAQVGAGAHRGVGGALLVAGQGYVSPADAGFGTSSLLLLAAVLGGIASPPGALAGTVLVVLARDQLAAHWPGHGPLVLGVLFVAAVYLLPRGLAGLRPATVRPPRTSQEPPTPTPCPVVPPDGEAP
ncbi:branched-chain amino acid ABC transporter permease [Kitasatospora nipponensis]|uniref:Branched-chain amino acid ABC transporter permease n=1 Tax=Kitasatospora nipponensis TaxID=258049 RepID=A0ABN1WW31_9ACTN